MSIGSKTAAAIVILSLSAPARAQMAPQIWDADQDGGNFICANVGYFQANNLAGVGTRFACTDPTGKLVPSATPCVASGAIYYQTVQDATFGVLPQEPILGTGFDASNALCASDDPANTRTNIGLCSIGNIDTGTGAKLVKRVISDAYGRLILATTGAAGSDYQPATAHTCGGGQFVDEIDATGTVVCGTPTDTGITQLTHDVTAGPGSGSQSANVVGIEDDAICRGDLLFANEAAPTTPGAGDTRVWADATAKTLTAKNDTGVVTHMAQTQTAAAGKAFTALSAAGAFTETSFQAPLTACTDYVSLTCVSGATDLGGTNATPTVIGIENTATMRGDVVATNIAAPGMPAAGKTAIYVDNGSKNIVALNDGGIKNHGIQNFTCGTSPQTFVKQVSSDGSSTCGQASFSDVSGSATCVQMPALTGDTHSSAGSCATVTDHITESSGPTSLAVGAIPDSNPDSTVLVRPSGATTVVGISRTSFLAGVLMFNKDYYVDIPSGTLNSSGGWVVTSSPTLYSATAIEYTVPFAVTNVHMFISGTVFNNPVTGGGPLPAIQAQVTKNGSAMVGVLETFGLGVSGNYNGTFVSTVSFSAGDTVGIRIRTSGSPTLSGNFTATISFGWEQ